MRAECIGSLLVTPFPFSPLTSPLLSPSVSRSSFSPSVPEPLRGEDDERTRLRDKNPKGNKESWKSREMS